jgi:glutathione S-transferase
MIRFWYGSGSPFAWRVQLVIEEKRLRYEPILLSFAQGDLKTPEHLARHPHGKVPVIADDDVVVYESTAIVEYLDERYLTPPLLPRDPARRAGVRMEELECVEYFAAKFRDVARQAFFTPKEKRDEAALASARAEARSELARLEARAAARGGLWIAGAEFSRADCTWLPFVEIAARAGVEVDAAGFPWLIAWRERMRARPSYDRTYPPHWRKG